MKLQKSICAFFLTALCACSHSSIKKDAQTLSTALTSTVTPTLRPLEKKAKPKTTHNLSYEFSWGDRKFLMYAGKLKLPDQGKDWNRMYGWGPVIAVTDKGETRILDLRNDFPSHYVSHVFHDSFSGRIFVFLDFGIEGPAGAYSVWISEDRGENWFAGENLKRPPGKFPPGDLESFYLNGKGEGTAWFRYEAGNLPEEERDGALETESVYYKSVTHDNGKTWTMDTKPKFSSTLAQERGLWP